MSRIAAINEAALAGARLFSSLSPKCDNTINELPSGIPVQPSDLLVIYRDQSRQIPVSQIVALGGSRELVMYLSGADFTPGSTGIDLGSVKVAPYNMTDGALTNVPWQVQGIFARLEVAGSSSTTITIERYTGTGAFSVSNALNTSPLTLGSGVNEGMLDFTGIANPLVNSQDKLAVSYGALGSGASGFSVWVVASAVF